MARHQPARPVRQPRARHRRAGGAHRRPAPRARRAAASRSAASSCAIALRGGGTVDVLGIHVTRAHAVHADAAADRAGARAARRSRCGRGCRCDRHEPARGRRRASSPPRASVMAAAARAGALRLRRAGDQRQRRHAAPTTGAAARRASICSACSCPTRTTPLWGDGDARRARSRGPARADAFPEAVGSLSLVALAVLVGWRGGAPAGSRRGIRVGITVFCVLLALGPVRPRRRPQHPDPDAVERAALRAHPRPGALARPLRGRWRRWAWRVLLAQALAHLGRQLSRPGGAPSWRSSRVLLAIELVPGAAHALLGRRSRRSTRPSPRDPRPQIRVLELPFGVRDGTSLDGQLHRRGTQYFQTAHGKAIIGGYLSRVSPRAAARRPAARRC